MSADQDRGPKQSTAWLDQLKKDSGLATVLMSESVNGNVDNRRYLNGPGASG
jgi:hypothetical protein